MNPTEERMDWRMEKKLPLERLDEVAIVKGGHHNRDNGLCVMELAAWVAGRPHTDRPECVSPVIGAFLRRWNDDLPDDAARTSLLKPLIPVILDTRTTDEDEQRRAMMAVDWLLCVFTPALLDTVLSAEAAALRALPEIRTTTYIRAAASLINRVHERAEHERAKRAEAVSYDAARAYDAAEAWNACWVAASAVRDAVVQVCGDTSDGGWAVWAVGRIGDAAWSARTVISWTVVSELQRLAVELVERMAAVGRDA